MKALVLSDYHGKGEVVPGLEKILQQEKYDLIVFCGDISGSKIRGSEYLAAKEQEREPFAEKPGIREETRIDKKDYRIFTKLLCSSRKPVYLIPGNMDTPYTGFFEETRRVAQECPNLHIIHQHCSVLGDYCFSGLGGEVTKDEEQLFFVYKIPQEDAEIQTQDENKKLVLVCHVPPQAQKVDFSNEKHLGKKFYNELIEKHRPKYVFCGHIHDAQAWEKIGETIVVNPGALKYRNYALVDLDTGTVELKKF